MDRIDAMQAFVTVADLEGFAPAARKLGVSASNVTRLIAAGQDVARRNAALAAFAR